MTRTRTVLLALLVPATALAFWLDLFVTGFLACGFESCQYGSSFDPVLTQVALLGQGALLVPLALVAVGPRRLRVRAAAVTRAVVVGAVTAMAVLWLGPSGCPLGQDRIVAGAEDYLDEGSASCTEAPYPEG